MIREAQPTPDKPEKVVTENVTKTISTKAAVISVLLHFETVVRATDHTVLAARKICAVFPAEGGDEDLRRSAPGVCRACQRGA